ncbi:MAG: redox-active disulfide protein 2 [Verrucomicrobia bacterium]|nr:redox-active disulfide protein 2 [Cytophagales bacterium]
MSLEELKNKEKTQRSASGILAGMIIALFVVSIFLFTKQGFSVFTVLPITFLPILLANYSALKKIKEEIAARNS